MSILQEKPDVRFVQPVAKDQARFQSKPLFPEVQSFNTDAPILPGAYRTMDDKAFK